MKSIVVVPNEETEYVGSKGRNRIRFQLLGD